MYSDFHDIAFVSERVEILQSLDGEIEYIPNFLSAPESEQWLSRLTEQAEWVQPKVRLFGKWHSTPRLVSYYADPGIAYSYSGNAHVAGSWLPLLDMLRHRVAEQCGTAFNSVLLNLYRNGQDHMGWHADNELELGRNPTLASLSLGAERDFHLKHSGSQQKLRIALASGSLLIMRGALQHHWQHCLPKRAKISSPRVNLTFRQVHQKS